MLTKPGPATAGAASARAFPARVKPITIAMGPVIVGGRRFSITSLPSFFTRIPAKMEIKPDITIPKVTIWMSASGRMATLLSFSAPTKPTIAPIYEKLEP